MNSKLLRIILPIVAILAAFLVASCGGNNTYSATTTGQQGPVTLTIAPLNATPPPNSTLQYTATVTGTNQTGVTWTLLQAGVKKANTGKGAWGVGASISSTGLLSTGTFDSDYTVVATLTAFPSISASTPVTVTGTGIDMTIAPQDSTTQPNIDIQYTATVTGTSNTGVTWSLLQTSAKKGSVKKALKGKAAGTLPATISSTGLFYPGNEDGDYTIQAVCNAEPSLIVTTPVTVAGNPVYLEVAPQDQTIDEGVTQTFTATEFGRSGDAITWSVLSGGGSITSGGVFTSPFNAGTCVIQAQLTAFPEVTATASININGEEDIARPQRAIGAKSATKS